MGREKKFLKTVDSVVVIHTLHRSQLHDFVDAVRGTGFSWGSRLVLMACNCDGSCSHRVKKISVAGMGIRKIFVPLFFFFFFSFFFFFFLNHDREFELNFVFSEEPRCGGGSSVPG